MKPGIYYELSNDEYHGGPGVNKGLLDVVARSPLHAKAVLDRSNDDERTPTAAMAFGTAFHTLVLEPHLFAEQYVCELTQADAPNAVSERDQLLAMVEELNAGRLPKLATGGTKPEQVQRIIDAYGDDQAMEFADYLPRTELEAMKGADLKALLERINATRPGKFSTSGTMRDLAAILNDNGESIVLWQDVRERWDAENEGYTVLSVGIYNQLLGMAEAVKQHPMAAALLHGREVAATEASIYAIDAATGKLVRCRPDFWRGDGIMVDLKSTEDASPEGFGKSISNYRYHVQAPWYLDIGLAAYNAGHFPQGWAPPKAFVFVAVEKRAPYAVGVYALDAASMELGRAELRADLDKLAECERTGIWPGYGDKLQQIGVPQYYLNRRAHLLGAA